MGAAFVVKNNLDMQRSPMGAVSVVWRCFYSVRCPVGAASVAKNTCTHSPQIWLPLGTVAYAGCSSPQMRLPLGTARYGSISTPQMRLPLGTIGCAVHTSPDHRNGVHGGLPTSLCMNMRWSPMGAMCVVKSDLHTPVPNGSRICGEEKLAYYAVPNECRIRSEDIPAHTMVPLGAMSLPAHATVPNGSRVFPEEILALCMVPHGSRICRDEILADFMGAVSLVSQSVTDGRPLLPLWTAPCSMRWAYITACGIALCIANAKCPSHMRLSLAGAQQAVDIFAPPPPVVEDEKAIALKREVNELRGRLQAMVEVAPVADDKTLLEKEEWCQQWKDLIDSLTTCMQRQNGQSGNKIRDTLQGQLIKTRDPYHLQAEQERQAQAEKDGAATVQDHTQEGDEGHEDNTEADNGHEENTEADDGREDNTEANDGQEDHARADAPQADEDGTQQQLTPSVPSDSDAPKPVEAVVNPKCARIPKKIIANAVPCTKCVRIGRTCYPTSVGNVCKDCKRLKVKCSLASDKNKGKEQPTPTPAPPPKATAAKPRPRPITRQQAGLPRKAAAPVSAAKPQGQAKEKDGSSPYVEIKVARKRKHVEVEEESSESESEGDDEDEDAYMAGRLNGLNTFVNMFETAFGALKKEVAEIDSYLGRKRRRHHK
ncbi:hypothetical protein BD769DRAFT_1683049 [Suillus cothurnatus]|nr:hypothetical protein BD769DRAFT_1683049 [Suillus cothurnatus]